MISKVQSFGGSHTERKLDVVAKYLSAYVTVMKRRSFELHYVDGFAGSGASAALGSDEAIETGLFDTREIVQGSPIRALNIIPPFDRYLFIDSNESNIASLQKVIDGHSNRDRATAKSGDANVQIAQFCDWLETQRMARAVVFLDPFGLAVKWETIAKLAATGKVDLWYLVPVHGMSRQIKNNGEFLASASKIDDLWGSNEWRNMAVRRIELGNDLFGQVDERLEKIAKAKQFSEMFRDHLKQVFGGRVAESYLPLGKGRLHEFSLMFACANPNPKAFEIALRIANHVLRTA
jgi:three-Cys-motif partner protein